MPDSLLHGPTHGRAVAQELKIEDFLREARLEDLWSSLVWASVAVEVVQDHDGPRANLADNMCEDVKGGQVRATFW